MATGKLASTICATLLAANLAACSFASSPGISGRALARQIDSHTAPVVLDVRSDSEYAAGHVPGAVHISFQSVAARHDELAIDKDRRIVVTCAHGPRALWAARSLRKAGYTNVVYLEGHMSAWEAAGLPLESGPTAAAD